MRKLKLLLSGFALLGGVFSAQAQKWVDVTPFYLANGDFEGSYSIQKTFQSGNNERYIFRPAGWTVVHDNENTNDITVLKDGDKQSGSFKYFNLTPTDGGNQAYLVRFRWGGQYWDNGAKGTVDKITLSQIQTIPSGKYRLSADLVYITAEQTPSGWLRIYADKTAGGSCGYVDAETVKATNSGETISSGSASWQKKTTGEFDLDASTEIKFAMEFVQSWRWEIQAGGDNYKLERQCPDGAYTIDAAASVCGFMENWSLKTGTFDNGNYAERWQGSLPSTGDYLKYTLNNVPNGTYQVKVTAKSSNTGSRDGFEGVTDGATTYASIVAGTVEQAIPTWNALDAATGDSPQQYTLSNIMVTDGKLVVALNIKQAGPNWMIAKIDEIQFQGTYLYDYNMALAAAEDAVDNADYDNVIGTERSDLNTQIGETPVTPSDYVTITAGLISKTEAFTAAKTNYDALVREIAKAKALGIATATAESYAATASSTSASVLTSTQELKVLEYDYVIDNYKYSVSLGDWTSTGTNTKAATFNNEHWSGTTHDYMNQDDNNGQGWNAASWRIDFNQNVTLPAGNYVFKVAGRQASGDAVTTSLVVKKGEDVLGTVSDFPRSNNTRGINKSGETAYEGEDSEFANGGKGYGWEWRYVKFTLASDATVNIAVNAVATAYHQWVSFGDYTLETDNEANISLIAYNISLNDANTAINNSDYDNVTGTEREELQDAIDADGTLDKSKKDDIDAAKALLDTKKAAFIAAKDSYDAWAVVKDATYADDKPYASAAKYAAIATAQAATPTTAAAAATAAAAVTSAYRKYVESNALAEGVAGAEQITVADYRFAGLTNSDIDAENWMIGDNWHIESQNNGSIAFNIENCLTDGDGNADYNYIRIQKSDNNAGIYQTINLAPGQYIMTVTARCQSGQGAKFEAYAGGVWVDIPQDNNTGGQFGRGWNDVSVVFNVLETSDVNIGVKSNYGKNIWWNATRFRLVRLGNAQVTIDEDVNYTVAAGTADVTLKRTLKSDTWNTFVVPFNITNSELKALYGNDVQVAEYSEVADGANSTIYFNKMATPEITANKPVLLKPKSGGSLYVFVDRTITSGDAKVAGTNYDFVGTYDAEITIDADDYFIGSNQLWKSAGTTTIAGTRAYIKAVTTDARISEFSIGENETTGIRTISTQQKNQVVYDMQGRRVETMKKGIYVVDGKKVVVK